MSDRSELLARRAARAASAVAPTISQPAPAPTAADPGQSTARGPGGKQSWGGRTADGTEYEVAIVPRGTPKEVLRQKRSGAPQGTRTIDGHRRQRSPSAVAIGDQRTGNVRKGAVQSSNVQTVPSGGVRKLARPGDGGSPAPQVPRAIPTAPAAVQTPQPRLNAPSPVADPDKPVADLTVILAYHDRPALIEPQQRCLFAQSLQPQAKFAWVNASDQVAFSPSQLALVARLPHAKTNMDVGPWMRWGIASQCATKYVLVLDDDALPGTKWIEAAIARMESGTEHMVVACAGQIYGSDEWDDVMLLGPTPEAPPTAEIEVDVGRGGWLMRTETARQIAAAPRAGEILSTGLHIAAVVQSLGGGIVVLPYGNDKNLWGMVDPPKSEGSVSAWLDAQAQASAGETPSADAVRADIYAAYREQGWEPWCVIEANEEATTEAPAEAEKASE